MKKRITRSWIPFWGDKWLFGSMRQEFNAAERGIWWDLMAMAMKDEGHIRANEDFAYPIEQLAGFFLVPKDELQKAIDKFVKVKKLMRDNKGILYITNWKKYCFTDRHMRRLGMEVEDEMSAETDNKTETEDTEGTVPDTRKEKNRIEKNGKEKIKTYEQGELEKLFEKWWKRYPRTEDKGKAKSKYFNLIENEEVDPQQLEDALTGYINVLNNNETEKQYVKTAKTFLYNGNKAKKIDSTWVQFIKYADPKYRKSPSL